MCFSCPLHWIWICDHTWDVITRCEQGLWPPCYCFIANRVKSDQFPKKGHCVSTDSVSTMHRTISIARCFAKSFQGSHSWIKACLNNSKQGFGWLNVVNFYRVTQKLLYKGQVWQALNLILVAALSLLMSFCTANLWSWAALPWKKAYWQKEHFRVCLPATDVCQ